MSYEFSSTASIVGGISRVAINGTGDIAIAAPEVFGGPGGTTDPEELFVASIHTCIMMSFVHFAKKGHVQFDKYQSSATGVLEKDEGGFRFARVAVDVAVATPQSTDEAAVRRAAELAEKYCLVTRSLNCPVEFNLTIKTS